MLHELICALASLLPQDGAPAPANPPAANPAAPAAPAAAPKTDPASKLPVVAPAPDPRAQVATTKNAKPPSKNLVIPTPKPKDPEIPSYRVSVRMPGNRRFTGVITRDRVFNEMARAGAHNSSDAYLRNDQFTLHFVDGVDGDVTLRWNQIKKLDVREILDAAGVHTIEQEYHRLMILRKETEEAELRKAEEDAAKEGDKSVDDAKGDAKEKSKEKPKKDEEELPPLLAEFRPDQGWSPKRKEQIEWRRTVVGTAPDKAEQRFLEVYAEWLPLYGAWQLAHAPDSPDAKDGDAKKDAPKEDPRGDTAKGEAPKGDVPKKDDAKDGDGKKDEPKSDDAKKDAPAPKDGGGR